MMKEAKKIQLPRKTRQLPQMGGITGLPLVCFPLE